MSGFAHITNGWLRPGLLHVDDKPDAAQLWLVQDRVASIHRVSYDERFAKLSVETVLTLRSL
ncbi:MAG: GNAT family N-acetyltransferase [Acidobacteriia bacterium]|nr:GNAT family N-acetyltransferase [Terriglobia bacterium]